MPNNTSPTDDLAYWLELREKSGQLNQKHIHRDINGTHERHSHRESDSCSILWVNRETFSFPLHWHSCVEIIMPLENNYTVKSNRRTYELREGDILIIPPGELHELIAPSQGTRMILLFDLSALHDSRNFMRFFSLLSHSCLITKESMPDIYSQERELLIQITKEYISGGELRNPSILSYMIRFFVIWARTNLDLSANTLPDLLPNKQQEYVEKFNKAFNYIEHHYTEDISLEDVATQIGFSKFHFSRLFHQFTDTSFYDYLCLRRLRAAESLLLNPALPITEVALQSGFSSISTFNRVFKKYKKCTPSEFKEFYKEIGK